MAKTETRAMTTEERLDGARKTIEFLHENHVSEDDQKKILILALQALLPGDVVEIKGTDMVL